MKKTLITSFIFAAIMPFMASAATVEELQAQINMLVAQLSQATATSNTASCGSISRPLTLGDTDVEVVELQRILNQDSYTQVAQYGAGSPGSETMFFGPATQSAVMRFQLKYANEILAPQGFISPTGFVGYATIAKLNSLCSVAYNTSYSNGSVLGASTESGITTGTNSSNNNSSSNSYSNELNGGAGTFTATKYSSDVEDNVVTGSSDIVLSFKGRAEGSDIKLTHIKINLDKTGSTGSTYPNRYFESFSVYADDSKVGTALIEDFGRDSSGHYSMTLRLSDAVIKMGSSRQVVFKIKANAVSSIDSDNAGGSWSMTVSDMRYTDATGVTLINNDEITDSNFYVEKLSSSGDIKVKISTGSNNPDERNVFVSDSSSGDKVTLNEFKIKAEGSKIAFDTLKVDYSTSGASINEIASELQLLRNDSVIDTVDTYSSEVSGGVATFNLDDQQYISQDDTVTYKIVARMQKINSGNFNEGDRLLVSFRSINAEDRNGDTVTSGRYSGSSTGRYQTFRSTGIDISKVSSSAYAVSSSNSSSKGYGRYTMDIRVTASGDDMWIPLTSSRTNSTTAGILYTVGDGTGSASAVVSRLNGGTEESGYVKIADGESATIRLNVSYDPTGPGFSKLTVGGVNYTLNKVDYSSISATPSSDFETESIDIRP